MKFSIKDFFNKCDEIRSFLRIWSHLLGRSLMENFIFCDAKACLIFVSFIQTAVQNLVKSIPLDSILGSPIYLEYQILVSGPEFLVSEKIDFKFNIMFKDIFQNYYDFLVLKPRSSRFTNTAEYFRGHTNVHLKLFSCHYFTSYS